MNYFVTVVHCSVQSKMGSFEEELTDVPRLGTYLAEWLATCVECQQSADSLRVVTDALNACAQTSPSASIGEVSIRTLRILFLNMVYYCFSSCCANND